MKLILPVMQSVNVMLKQRIFRLIFITFLIKLALSFVIELNNDEVYYWTYAQKLQWNYFDHPPGIALLIRIFTLGGLMQQVFFLRLGACICGAVSTWLIYLIGKNVKDENSGFFTALLFTASPYGSFIAGFLVIPDAPQLVFWLASVLQMVYIINTNSRRPKQFRYLLFLGLLIGLSILCKVHAVFLWVGFMLYIIFFKRKLLLNPSLLYAGLITALVISPIIFWNISNDFVSYRYHSGRVSFFGTANPEGLAREILGEFLYNNPVSVVLLALSLIAMFRQGLVLRKAIQRLLLLIALPLVFIVLLMALFKDTLPHWTGPAYITVLPLVGAWLSEKYRLTKPGAIPRGIKWSLGVTMALLALAVLIVKWLPVNMGSKENAHLGEGDPTLDMEGFSNMGIQFKMLSEKDQKNKLVKPGAFILSDYWFPAAHLDYYFARPAGLGFMAMGDLPAIHHYAWLNKTRPALQEGDDAYFIAVSNYFKPPSPQLIHSFNHLMPPEPIIQYRAGTAVRIFFIYRLLGYKRNVAPVYTRK